MAVVKINKPSTKIRAHYESAEFLKRLAQRFGQSTQIILDTILTDTNAVHELAKVFNERKKK